VGCTALGTGHTHILFGEWLMARHTMAYDMLPDWFIAFDIFDTATNQFLSK
jgi:hypothetical protein